jgi:hypothetical protein
LELEDAKCVHNISFLPRSWKAGNSWSFSRLSKMKMKKKKEKKLLSNGLE